MPPASIAVVAYPYLYASALEGLFRTRGFEVTAPDIMVEEWEPSERYDVVMTNLPLGHEGGHIHIDLPSDYAEAVRISIAGVAVEKVMDPHRPVEELIELIGVLVAEPVDVAADRLVALVAGGHRHAG